MTETAKLTDLISTLESDSPDHVTRYDRESGRIVRIEECVLRDVEAGEEAALTDLEQWQDEEVAIARAMAADASERFIDPPSRFEFHEYRRMERYVRSLPDEGAAEQLWRAIKGKGAFRYFRDTLHRLGLLEQWYRYRQQAMKEFVIQWAKANQVPYEDDLREGPAE